MGALVAPLSSSAVRVRVSSCCVIFCLPARLRAGSFWSSGSAARAAGVRAHASRRVQAVARRRRGQLRAVMVAPVSVGGLLVVVVIVAFEDSVRSSGPYEYARYRGVTARR